LPYNAFHASASGVARYGTRVDWAPEGFAVGRADFNAGTTDGTADDTRHAADDGTRNDPQLITRGFVHVLNTAAGTPLSSSITDAVANRAMHDETINVIIPRAEGIFAITVSNAPVQLSTATPGIDHSALELSGELGAVTISDSRYQSQPGWSIFGQVGDFSGGGPAFNGSYLGWSPMVLMQDAAHDVAAGPAVTPGTNPGLKRASELGAAAATKGLGTTVLGATLYLKVPASTPVRSQSATLTITIVEYP
jgi:hypothetical protein